MLEALRRHLSTWWGMSLAIHAALLCCVLFVAPVREAIFGEGEQKTELTVEGERLNQIVEEIRHLTGAKLARRMQGMYDMLDQMKRKRERIFGRLTENQGQAAVAAIRRGFQSDDQADRALFVGTEELAHETIPRIIDVGRASENATATVYQHIRAATLAMIQEVTIDEAMKTAKIDRPRRDPLDAQILTEPIYRTAQLIAFRRELKTAENDLDAMISYVQKMLEHVERLEQLEDAGKITLAMYEAYGGGAGAGSVLMPWEIFDSGRPIGTGEVRAIPGRKITRDGRPADWMFIDTWYIIGPFPNDRRDNLNTKFLPETVVDLDAVYPGKDGTEVRWEYTRSPKVCVDPQQATRYAIWYAFTEVYCEEEMDLWMAVGGDDFCKLWINDELIWVSSEIPKAYYAFEHLQVIHLKKGANRILFRIENAGGTVGFSIMLCTKIAV